jgi:Family of unknown function (DUF6519)/Right handed beta helix region
MSGDYSRFSFHPRKRFSAVLQQQGRPQLDSDWNEEVSIVKRRERVQALDIFGPFGVPQQTTPDAFKIGAVAGSPADFPLQPGRLYIDGWLVEAFADDNATYLNQPFYPAPPPLPSTGDAVVYLDVWEREVTYIEDASLLDVALGGVDTATRTQTVWQVRVAAAQNAVCGLTVGDPPSAGRLTTSAIAPPAPDDPCILPPLAGYRGLENRLYRVEIQDPGALGTATFKWSRDNGSIASVVTDIAVSGSQTTLRVNRIGRDQFLRFFVDNWVTVSDDDRELMGESGDMARIVFIDEANSQIVLDRALSSAGSRPFGANQAEIAKRHTRVQRWDQTAATNVINGNGVVTTAAGPINLEDGVTVAFAADPVGGTFRIGDYWAFWARTATANVEVLDHAPPRGIVHHYAQLAAITGLGGSPQVTNCRPSIADEHCCCTVVVPPGKDLVQKAIDALPDVGGCVCLKAGTHLVSATVTISKSFVKLVGESIGATVRLVGQARLDTVLSVGGARRAVEGVEVSTIRFEGLAESRESIVIAIINAQRCAIENCWVESLARSQTSIGIYIDNSADIRVAHCAIAGVAAGLVAVGTKSRDLSIDDNEFELRALVGGNLQFSIGVNAQQISGPCRIAGNTIRGPSVGIDISDNVTSMQSLTTDTVVSRNFVSCAPVLRTTSPLGAIKVAASRSIVSENIVELLPDGTQSGIAVTGTDLEVSGNQLRTQSTTPQIGIQIGSLDATSQILTSGVTVSDNTIIDFPIGILANVATDVVIQGNRIRIEGSGASGILGVSLAGVQRGQVQGNVIDNFQGSDASLGVALSSVNGSKNSVSGNVVTNSGYGVLAAAESTPTVSRNRIDNMKAAGVAVGLVFARCEIVENRITSCGSTGLVGGPGLGIGALIVIGELHIEANEVMDTGLSGAASATTAYGIAGLLVLEARVESNLVTYSDLTKRPATGEDRALWMQGLIDLEDVGDTTAALGFAVQILGNKFVGTGSSALVELAQTVLTGTFYLRFARVEFSNNYCMQVANPRTSDKPTIVLVGKAATVTGNHVKATGPKKISVLFGKTAAGAALLGPYIGNVAYAATSRASAEQFPAPESSFNLTV